MSAIRPSHDRLIDRPPAAIEHLAERDLPVAEALVAAMADWDAADLAAYRSSVLDELAKLRGRPPRGFLAAELAALSAVGAANA